MNEQRRHQNANDEQGDIGQHIDKENPADDISMLGKECGAGKDTQDQQRADQHGGGGIAGNAEGEGRNQCAARCRVVGALRGDNPALGTLAIALVALGECLGDRIGGEG